MNGKMFFFGAVVGGVVVALLLRNHEQISSAVLAATSNLSFPGIHDSASDSSRLRIDRPTQLPILNAVDVKMPFGTVQLTPGTQVLALRETESGILAQLGGQEISLPLSAFIEKRLPSQVPIGSGPDSQLSREVPVQSTTTATGVAQFAESLLIVDGDAGRGSASIISIRGIPLIVTNAHVLEGNKQIKFRRLNSQELKFDKLGISKDYDLAVATQKEVTTALPMLEGVEKNVAVGDDVVVLGNSLGSHVVTEITGKVTGIGPDLIEVDAKFVHGNSGSPIIHSKTGKVLAIATFATVRKLSSLDKDSQFQEIRRFGYRLDTANRWDYPKWPRFVREGESVKQLRVTTDCIVALARDIYDDGFIHLDPHQGQENPVRPFVTAFLQVIKDPAGKAAADIYSAKQKLFRELLFLTKVSSRNAELETFCSWHRKALEEERQNRDFLHEKFTELANRQDADRKINLP